MKKQLVILTTHFGTNFSGGSTATCEIFSRLESQFEQVVVVGTQIGDHPFKSIRFIKYTNWFEAVKIIKELNREALFYGDFYNAFLFILARVPFYFTYHDNWPELGREGLFNRLRSLFYTNIYNTIFKRAKGTITVSQFKLNYINQYTTRATLVYNGFNGEDQLKRGHSASHGKKIVMVGNIDNRKYGLALKLFKQLSLGSDMSIDIYGNIIDLKLAENLAKFPFVNIKGFMKDIPYYSYDLLLHTSIMENLPIVFCEAVYTGVPVLAFDVGGSNEIIDKNSGLLIPPYDLNLMENRLKHMLVDSKKMQPNDELLNRHSWNSASKNYLDLFIQ